MTRLTRRSAITLTAAAALGLTACGGGSDPLSSSTSTSGGGSEGGGKAVVVGSADFSESILLAEIYAGALRAKGVDASTKTGIGSREVYLKALEDGSISVVPEYTGALALYYDQEFAETDPDKTYDAAEEVVPDGLELLEKSAAEDNDALVVTKETADSKGLKTIEDLQPIAQDLTLAAPAEFKDRAQGIPGLKKTYDIEFGTFRPLKAGQAMVQALKNGQVDVANIFSTDPNIPANDFVVLEDTKKLYGSQNVVPLVREDVEDDVDDVLDEVSKALTTEKLSELLQQTDIEKKDHKEVAEGFLKDAGLA